MTETNTNLSRRDLNLFGLILLLFFALLGAMALWKPQALVVAACVLTVAVVVSLILNGSSPRPRQLLGFLLPAGMGLIGGSAAYGPSPLTVATIVWIAGGVVSVVIWAAPGFARTVYGGWMDAAEPVGWTLTNVLLAIVFYLVVTPIGLIMRLSGRDPMQRRFEPSAGTYWIEHSPPTDPDRYFQQF